MADFPDLFEVQKVLSRRTRKGNVEYLIRWKGYGSDYDTWEPQGGLVACWIMVNLYNQRHDYPLMGAHGETIRPKKKPNSSKIAAKARLNKAKGKKPSPGLNTGVKRHTKLKTYPVRNRENSLSDAVNETSNLAKNALERVIKPKSKVTKQKDLKKKVVVKKVAKQSRKSDVSRLIGEKPKGLKTAKSTKVKVKETDVKVKVSKISKQSKVKAFDSAEVKSNSNKKAKITLGKAKAADAVDGCVTNEVKVKVGKLPKVKVASLSDESSDFDDESEDEDYVRYMLAPALLKKLETLDLKRPASCHQGQGDVSGPKRKKIKDKKCDNKTQKNTNKISSQQTVCNKKKSNCSGKCKKPGEVDRKGNLVRRGSICSSRGKISPKAAGKLLPMKPLHVETEFAQPVSLPKAPVTKMESKLLIPGALDFATIYKTPPTSPQLTRSSSNTPSRPSTPVMPVHNGYFADLPTMPLVPTLPSSPSTDSYLSLITDLPQKLQATKLFRRVGGQAEDEEEVKRRVSVRQSESAFKYRDIVVKKCARYTQIWLFTNTKFRNALNPHVFQELISAFHNAKYDDSRLVMLSGTGRIFCSGIDLFYLSSNDTKSAVNKMLASLREFIKTLISFPKPIVAAVNGPAVGLGAAILPLCDIVYASDKAEFYMPYTRLAQTPEGCASFMFPTVMGLPLANEMLLGGRKLTAIEAYQNHLVSQVCWPTSMMQEVIPKVESMANQSAKALEATKLMVRSHLKAKMDYTNESECNMLYESWLSTEFQRTIKKYLEEEEELLH